MRKEMIEKYRIPIRDIVRIKKGEDFITEEGLCIPNHDLTLAPFRARSYAYCSDTRANDKILPLIKDVDLLYHETTFAHRDQALAYSTFHSTTVQAAELAVRAGADKLLMGHFSSRYKKISELEDEAREIFPDTIAVNDGDVFHVEQERQTD